MDYQSGILHCHSENSARDSAEKVKKLVARAVELGAPAIALTDHGVVTGFYSLINECKSAGIKPIPGVEAYFGEEKRHLIIMAKDIDGYTALAKAVTESNRHMSGGANNMPLMNYEILEKHFGKDAEAHGKVIATSACMNGVLSGIILSDEDVKHEADKIRRKRDKYHPLDNEALDMAQEQEDLADELRKLMDERDRVAAIAKKNIAGLTRRLKSLIPETDEAKALNAEIESAKKEKETAAADLPALKNAVASQKRKNTLFNQKYKQIESQVNKWLEEDAKAKELEASIKPDAERYAEAKEAAIRFEQIFGKGNFYIELQYHGEASEKRCMPILAELAAELGIPVIAANDAHYATKDGAHAREIMTALRFERAIPENLGPSYGELYIKTDAELREALTKILPVKTVEEAINNIKLIVDECNVELKGGTHYPVYKSNDGEETDPGKLLRELAEKGIALRYPCPSEFTEEHRNRLEYELAVIGESGYNDYLCIVQDFLNYGRTFGKNNEHGVGYTIGPGRGSAVGSLVCYLTGITSIDPLKYGLLFERFLNRDRVSMPDIDSDFHTGVRGKAIDYVKQKYGENAVASIMTRGTMAAKLAIRNAARVTDVPLSVADTLSRMIPNKPGQTLAKELPIELQAQCDANPVAAQLIEDAKLIEGTTVSYGTHAAGIIIADNGDISDYVALMYNIKKGTSKKGTWAVQCDMGEAEHEAGLLKMDFLGLRNLDIIDSALKRIKANKGIEIDIERIPFEHDVFSAIYATAKTNSIFQFESSGMKEMLRKFRPESIEDIILLVAAFRPGPMQYLDDIINVKHGREKTEYIASALEPILAETYGKPIYQEQVMQIFNKVAGFSLGEADIIRRAMGKKKMEILTDPKTNYKGKFIDGLISSGATAEQAEKFWVELLDFANYAFNKSHATAYAFVSYYTAWLKHNYPAEFFCAVMDHTIHEKLSPLLAECKTVGLTVSAPDINVSQDQFTNYGEKIMFGFSSISGLGNSGQDIIAERNANGQFKSFKDLVQRMLVANSDRAALNKTALEALIMSGATDVFCRGNRQSLLASSGKLIETVKKMNAKQKELADRKIELSEKTASGATKKEIAALERKINNSEKAVAEQTKEIKEITFFPMPEDNSEKLKAEKKHLGFYVSGHPLDEYAPAMKKVKATPIALVTDGDCRVCGMIEDLRVTARKKDGAPMAFFKLTDQTGEVQIKCWSKPYAQYKNLIEENAVVVIKGKMRSETEIDDEGQEIVTDAGVSVNLIDKLTVQKTGKIIMSVPSIFDWTDALYQKAQKYTDNYGCMLVVHDLLLDEIREADFRVSEKILSSGFDKEGIALTKIA
jgi:DNA polymerase-3 subunit alpha